MEWNKTVEHATKALVLLLVAGASYMTTELNQAKKKSSELQNSLDETRRQMEELLDANRNEVEEMLGEVEATLDANREDVKRLQDALAGMMADAENLGVDLARWKHDKRMALCQNTVGRLPRCQRLIEELDSGSNVTFRQLRISHRDKLSDHWSFSEFSPVMGGPAS